MFKNLWKTVTAICVCGLFLSTASGDVIAASYGRECVGVEVSSFYRVRIDAPVAKLHTAPNVNATIIGSVEQGKTYDVISYNNGWVKVNNGKAEGYLKAAGQATVVETTREKVDEEAALRAEVVEYALQFVGNPYVYGGINPNTGADCSGFTSYVMRNAAGVSLSRSSATQAGDGRPVPVEEMKPGDLLFYSNGIKIDHVAIYAGNEQIVHASTERTGIKTSRWNYRMPVKVVSVLSR